MTQIKPRDVKDSTDPSTDEKIVDTDVKEPEVPAPDSSTDTPPVVEPDKPEEKTVPFERFQEVNNAKKVLEEKAEGLQDKLDELLSTDDDTDDEEGAIRKEMKEMSDKIDTLTREKEFEQNFGSVLNEVPGLKKHEKDFREFVKDKVGDVSTLAKSFMFDKGQTRKGLESPTAGPTEPPTAGYTPEEAEKLRKTDEKAYAKLVREGRLKFKGEKK